MKTKKEILAGDLIRVAIRVKAGYTSDLYNSIQGKEGKVLRKYEGQYEGEEAYLIQFDEQTTSEYYNTSNGKWSGNEDTNMNWWTKRKDFILIN